MAMDFKALEEKLKSNHSFSIFGHMNPDGDSIGAMLSMAHILRNHFGKNDVRVFSRDGVPGFLKFMPEADGISTDRERAMEKVDLVLLLDCGTAKRVGDELAGCVEKAEHVAVVDHHATNTGFGELNLTDPDASSTCEILYRFVKEIGVNIDATLAIQLYTGIMYDTGRFIHSNTTPAVFEICSDLVSRGADPAEIAMNVYSARTLSHQRLMGYVMSNFKTAEGGAIAYCAMTRKQFEELGAVDEDNEGVVEQMGGYAGCEVHATFMELADGRVRVSMRSKGRVNVGKICKKFDGGGHDLAAGIRFRKPLDEVVEEVIAETQLALEALKKGEAAV